MADFQWKGEWLGDVITGSTVPYNQYDNVTYEGIYYMCKEFASVGSPSPDMDTQKWDVILRNGLSGSSGSSGEAGSSGTSGVDGSSAVQEHWVGGREIGIPAGEVTVIATDYVLVDSLLYLDGPTEGSHGSSITIAGKTYNRDGKLSVFGDCVLSDVEVVNNGQIRVDGGLILDSNVIITGDGTII